MSQVIHDPQQPRGQGSEHLVTVETVNPGGDAERQNPVPGEGVNNARGNQTSQIEIGVVCMVCR